jgi:molybdate transport system substrate-binding protein
MNTLFATGRFAVLASIAVFVGIGAFLYWYSQPANSGPSNEPIIVHCADALRAPLEAIAAAYEKETEQKVELRINSSQGLLAQMDVTKEGDLYLPADDSFLRFARKKDLIRETLPLATMSAVVISNPNTRPIKAWADLVSADVALVLGNTDATAVGKLTREALEKSGHWADVEKRKPVFQVKISDVAQAVALSPRGAGIVFDAVAGLYPKLTVSELPELAGIKANVAVAVTSFSKQPTHALRFARYLAAKDRGLTQLAKLHYRVVEQADEFTYRPELRLFGGTMLRPAIQDTIREFAEREGITIATNWNGCGILVGEMKANKIPDIYFACEPRFMDKVKDLFEEPDIVSSNRLVIGVRKGNPHEVFALKDLAKDGLKVGIGNENQCALGDLTMQTFNRTGLSGKIRKNIAKEAPSGDLLISDFRAKALDVIVCYESNATPYLDEMDFVPIDIGAGNADCTNPLQPVAIAKACRYPQLARRLMDAFQTAESKKRFEDLGFGWVKKDAAP